MVTSWGQTQYLISNQCIIISTNIWLDESNKFVMRHLIITPYRDLGRIFCVEFQGKLWNYTQNILPIHWKRQFHEHFLNAPTPLSHGPQHNSNDERTQIRLHVPTIHLMYLWCMVSSYKVQKATILPMLLFHKILWSQDHICMICMWTLWDVFFPNNSHYCLNGYLCWLIALCTILMLFMTRPVPLGFLINKYPLWDGAGLWPIKVSQACPTG